MEDICGSLFEFSHARPVEDIDLIWFFCWLALGICLVYFVNGLIMCGISGFLSFSMTPNQSAKTLIAMLKPLDPRGPDQQGTWREGAINLGHKRLSIHDLSQEGAQPMVSRSGRFVIVFNGEIYNYRYLAERYLVGSAVLRTKTDTEVLLELIDRVGLKVALDTVDGMYAFALWDREKSNLYLARDRFGEKPLFYHHGNHGFCFSSTLNGLKEFPHFSKEIDYSSLSDYFSSGYISGSNSIFRNVFKVLPGTFLKISSGCDRVTISSPITYWSTEDRHSIDSDVSIEDAISHVDGLLNNSIRLQKDADVACGAFLSGGVDSSLVASIMQNQSRTSIDTFTMGFVDQKYDESPHAKLVADHIGATFNSHIISERDLLDVVPLMPFIFDETFSDSSQIPTYMVGKLAKRHVTVALSGDGADEVFGGYSRYTKINERWKKFSSVRSATSIPVIRQGLKLGSRAFFNRSKLIRDGARLCEYLECRELSDFYHRSVSRLKNGSALLQRDVFAASPQITAGTGATGQCGIEYMMQCDIRKYLCDDILVKTDRAFMASSLEGRAPFLSREIFEFSSRLPLTYHFYDGKGKYLLRRVLQRYLPLSLFDRPKQGFAVPISHWLRTELKDWAACGIELSGDDLNRVLIKKIWHQHVNGVADWGELLWGIIIFNYWRSAL